MSNGISSCPKALAECTSVTDGQNRQTDYDTVTSVAIAGPPKDVAHQRTDENKTADIGANSIISISCSGLVVE